MEILGGILSGTWAAGPGPGLFANGTLIICLDVECFIPLADFHAQVAALFGFVKSAPLLVFFVPKSTWSISNFAPISRRQICGESEQAPGAK